MIPNYITGSSNFQNKTAAGVWSQVCTASTNINIQVNFLFELVEYGLTHGIISKHQDSHRWARPTKKNLLPKPLDSNGLWYSSFWLEGPKKFLNLKILVSSNMGPLGNRNELCHTHESRVVMGFWAKSWMGEWIEWSGYPLDRYDY